MSANDSDNSNDADFLAYDKAQRELKHYRPMK
jgi:hypothetical protein